MTLSHEGLKIVSRGERETGNSKESELGKGSLMASHAHESGHRQACQTPPESTTYFKNLLLNTSSISKGREKGRE